MRYDVTTGPIDARELEAAVAHSGAGAICTFTGIVRDITEFKKAIEERLRLLNELEGERALLNSLLDNAPVGFGFFDHELRFLRVNPALERLFGFSWMELNGRRLVDLSHPDDQPP